MSDSEFNKAIQDILLEFNNSSSDKLSILAKVSNSTQLSFPDSDFSLQDLSNDNLSGIDLSRSNLNKSNLSKSDLSNANLNNANLRDADLSNSDLSYANLSNANLNNANLSNCNLSDANLSEANLVGAILNNTIFDRSIVARTTFRNNIGITEDLSKYLKAHGAEILTEFSTLTDKNLIEEPFLKTYSTSTLLEDLQSTRNRLIRLSEVEDVIQSALTIVRRKLNSQVVAIYLFEKDGRLHRVGIEGVDLKSLPIKSTWYPKESYAIGDSFIGKAAYPQNDGYGKPQVPENLFEDLSELDAKNHYIPKLGSLNCGIAVPLDGQNHTYGVLSVINKVDPVSEKVLPISSFPTDEIHWLSAIGSSVATAISYLRRDKQNTLEADLGRLLVSTPYDNITNVQHAYDKIVQRLVSENTAFKACILRVHNKTNTLEEVARSGDDINWNNRSSEEVVLGSHKKNILVIHEIVYKRREPFIFESINPSNLNLFSPNDKWINDNKFKAYGLFPLVYKNDVLGTLSLYTIYNYNFHINCKNFLNRITTLIAAFLQRVEYMRIFDEMDIALNDINSSNMTQKIDSLQSHVRRLKQ